MFSVAIKRAPALREGDRIRLVAPASPFPKNRFERGVRVLKKLGFQPVFDREEFRKTGFLAGEDADRARRIEQALLEEETQAVWCIRGGYGTARLLPMLDLRRLRARPKALIGFSDVTALLLSLSGSGGYVTFHGPVLTQLPQVPPAARRWLMDLLTGRSQERRVPFGRLRTVVPGRVHGFLLGGNLAVLSSLVGTPYFPELSGSILCIEDTGEEAFRLDRTLHQLHQSGALKNVFGVVIGALAGCKPAGTGQYGARRVLERAVAGLGIPAVSGADFGHIGRNLALPMGVLAHLDASQGTLTLLEPAVFGTG